MARMTAGETSERLGSDYPEEGDKSAEIYRAAATIFHEKGFHATSINEIAEAVNLTKAGLYYYIKGKQDLLFGIMKFAMDLLEQHVIDRADREVDSETRLESIVRSHAQLITEDSSALTILVNELEGLTLEHRAQIIGRQRGYLDFIRSTLEALRTEGKLRQVDSTLGAFAVLGMVLWISRWYRLDGRLDRKQVVEEMTQIALAAVLHDDGRTRPRGSGGQEGRRKETR